MYIFQSGFGAVSSKAKTRTKNHEHDQTKFDLIEKLVLKQYFDSCKKMDNTNRIGLDKDKADIGDSISKQPRTFIILLKKSNEQWASYKLGFTLCS